MKKYIRAAKAITIYDMLDSYADHIKNAGKLSFSNYARDYFENLDNDELVDTFESFARVGVGGTDEYATNARAAQKIIKEVVLRRLNG